jgi:glucose/arabinose dehydrogenase/cytochrome c551/c552/type 1 glutamine amidotransferase
MKYPILFLCALFLFGACSKKRSGKPRVLAFAKTSGYHHQSIPDALAALQQLGAANDFIVDTTTNAALFTEDTLKKYSAVIFVSTTGDVLDQYQEADFERYIQAGGGYVGIHAAADTEYEWGWYGRLAGGYFVDHPGINDTFPNVQPGVLRIKDKDHLATKDLPAEWKRTDEWYSYKKQNPDVKVLFDIDEASYQGGKDTGDHPMSWYHAYDGGRAFYTALGHTKESYTEDLFLKHILGGIKYAIGDNNELDYAKAKTLRVPSEERFIKTTLAEGEFYEPVELTVLPNLDILIAQRRGEILLYKQGDSTTKQVGFLKAYFKTKRPDVNAEEGVLGIKADPNFEKNHYVYIFYSPADTSVNRLSRFKFENDELDMKSEKVVLQFYSQREICCHTGGSIAFDKDGLLFVSTGDNSTPFDEPNQRYVNHGFAPLNDAPGHEQYDARRSSGNSNDLRGKILRIRVNEDGTYSIPDGNLYPEGTPKTRPEIYVQGNRNPYRISVDQKNGFVYWGEVGPDANADSLSVRGPRGYDEVNQARKAGFFGWPLFVGNNYAYHNYDYTTGVPGAPFDPEKPVNASRNNTGITDLPAAQPAFIWYPYGPSQDFPQVKTGGRNAMAGPAYYTDMFPQATRLPEYYNNKVFIYDWIRGWIKAVTLQPNGDFDKMEPFMEHAKFNSLIDMEVGPDGKLYLLEYGSGWFSKNKDSGLARVDYIEGNLPPKVEAFTVTKTSGTLPLAIQAQVKATDLESRNLTYHWDFGDGTQKETTTPSVDYTYEKAGKFTASVEVADEDHALTKSTAITVFAGNEMPSLQISVQGNQSFFFAGKPIAYNVTVKDPDDAKASENTEGLFISADYFESRDKVSATLGHQGVSDLMIGKNLTTSLDCKTCHKENEKSIGPAYKDVSKRYAGNKEASDLLQAKIKKGGSGVWGETNMPAHPDLKDSEARQIVSWILSLAEITKTSLPAQGTIKPAAGKNPTAEGVLVVKASYTDKGAGQVPPLSTASELVLINNKVRLNEVKHLVSYSSQRDNGVRTLTAPKGTGSFALEQVDLTDIKQIQLSAFWDKAPESAYTFEVHLDGPDGRKIGESTFKAASSKKDGTISIAIEPAGDKALHNVYIVSKSQAGAKEKDLKLSLLTFVSK